jgi:dTDP-4-amino-4,6-dideoxygalactose transaminase
VELLDQPHIMDIPSLLPISSIKVLKNETRIFGYHTAECDASGMSLSEFRKLQSTAAAVGIKLLIYHLPSSHPNANEILNSLYKDGHFSEIAQNYEIELNDSLFHTLKCAPAVGDSLVVGQVCATSPKDLEDIMNLGVSAGFCSSWAMDHNVTAQHIERLFELKMKEFLDPNTADVVLEARIESSISSTVVGVIVLHADGNKLTIPVLFVHPEHRRKGVGRALIVRACEWARTSSHRAIHVVTPGHNFPARRFLEMGGSMLTRTSHTVHMYLGSVVFNDLTQNEIPNSKPFFCGKELDNLAQMMQADSVQTNGRFGASCEQRLEKELGAPKVMLVTSGTAALEMCSLLIGSQAGAEVIMPSYTFVSTANAFAIHGATPVFVDIRADTQNIDETKIEAAITSRTKAIVCVHYSGIACEMDSIMLIAQKHKLVVIEDNAHGIFSTYKGRMLGTIGDLGALSFHYTKNIICGEGGAVVVNRPDFIAQAHVHWEKGTNRFDFLKGRVSKYAWVSKGSSFVMSEICAAVLDAQLSMWRFLIADRLRIWNSYHKQLERFELTMKLVRPGVPGDCVPNGHIYYIRVPLREDFVRLGELAKHKKISLFTHYEPLHSSAGGRKYGRVHGDCSESDLCASQLYRLPMWVGLSDENISKVIHLIKEALS